MAIETQIPRLAALIITDHSEGLPPVLGRSLPELQIARVVSAGARHIVCLVQQVSPQMLAVADNLRANGLTIDIVRSITDAADAIHPEENVHFVASPVLVSDATFQLLSDAPPSLLCVENDPIYGQFELIDGTARWTGYAYLNGATLRRIAGMIGDWDAASTLLRQLVQEDARRVVILPSQIQSSMLTVRNTSDAIEVGRRLLREDSGGADGFGSHWITTPISQLSARIAGELGVRSPIIEHGAVWLAIVAAIISLTGWVGIALFVMLISCLAQATGARLAGALADLNSRASVLRSTISACNGLVAAACAVTFASRTGQWGCLLLGALLLGSQILIVDRLSSVRSFARWLADPPSSSILLFIGIISTFPLLGLFVAAGHSLASYLCIDRKLLRLLADQE